MQDPTHARYLKRLFAFLAIPNILHTIPMAKKTFAKCTGLIKIESVDSCHSIFGCAMGTITDMAISYSVYKQTLKIVEEF